MRSLLQEFIQGEGYEADTVKNGSEALPRLVDEKFDMIITDIRMPGFSGLDILPGLRNIHPGIPIIVITAFGSEEVSRRAFARGATAYLEKPIHLDELRKLMQKMVSFEEKK